MGIALARSELEHLQRAACTMITGIMRTLTKVLEMLLDSPILGIVVESAALMTTYRLLRPDPRNLGTEHNWTWANVDNVDSKFSMIKDRVTQWRIFVKYRIVILTREQ